MSFPSLKSPFAKNNLSPSPVPLVRTDAASSIAETSADGNGEVINGFGYAVTDRGFVYSNSNVAPTLADSFISEGSGTGAYTETITGLSSSTTYYFRAYATSVAGTGYGEVLTFDTTAAGGAGEFVPMRMMMGYGI